jgi:hypothetical protein
VTSAAVWLPRRGELTVPNGVVDIPFVVERDHLLITIDRYDRAVPRMRPRADVLAELAPLFAAYGLVVARSHAVADRRDKFPEQCGSPDDEVVLARADGKPFSPTHVPALAALRAEPRVRTAGPLVRSNPWTSGEKSLGHRIHVYSLPHDVDLEPFARRHRGTWDPATRMLTLPPSTGLAAAGIATAIGRAYPGAMAELDMFAKVCRG